MVNSSADGREHLLGRAASVRAPQQLQRFLWRQTLIGVAINAVIPTGIIWALNLAPPASVLGNHAILPGMVLGSGLATLLMTPAVTLAVRAGMRERPVALPAGVRLTLLTILLPHNLAARALIMSVVAMLSIVPCFLCVIAAYPVLPLSNGGFIVWNTLYGATVGLTMTPIVVLRAIADAPRMFNQAKSMSDGDHPR